ncbi:MAG: RNA polymerase sigma factor, partial [Acidimicrobiia bacterium]
FTPTPIVALNRAIAVAELDGPDSALVLLDDLSDDLAEYHLFHATHAELLVRAGRPDDARVAFDTALTLVGNTAERDLLERRRADLAD